MRETRFEAFLEDLDLGPDGRFGIFIVAALKASMCSRSSAIELKVASLRDFSARIEKPDFDLVEPGSVGRRQAFKLRTLRARQYDRSRWYAAHELAR